MGIWDSIKGIGSKIKSTAAKIGPAIQQGGSSGGSSGSVQQMGTIFLKPSEESQASNLATKTGVNVEVVGDKTTKTYTPTGRVTTTGGRGSYQGPVQPGTSEEVFRTTGQSLQTTSQINQAIAKDTGVAPAPKVISTYKPPSLRDIPGYVKANIRRDIPGTIKGAGQIAYGAVAGFTIAQWNKLSDKEKRDAVVKQEEMKLRGGERERGFVPSGAGTIVRENIPYTNEDIVKLAESGEVSDTAALNELGRREGEKYGFEANAFIKNTTSNLEQESKNQYQQEFNQVQLDVKNKQQELQNKVDNGVLNANKANEQLNKYVNDKNTWLERRADEINQDTNTKLKNSYQGWLETRGAELEKDSKLYLDKVSDKVRLAKTLSILPLYVAGGFATGGALTAVAGTSATAGAVVTGVGTGAAVVTGGMTAANFYQSKKEGTLTATKVAATLVPMVTFGAGAYAGSRFAAPKVDSVKLNSALERAKVESSGGKGKITEAQIKTLRISETEKAEMLMNLRMGNSLREVNYKIVGSNSADKAIIKKGLPYQNIKVYEVINSAGKVTGEIKVQSLAVQSLAAGKVEVGRGLIKTKEDILGIGTGKTNLKTGTTTMDTLQIGMKKGDIISAAKTRTISKGQVKTIKTDTDDIFRITTSKGTTTVGKSIITSEPVQQPITARDIIQVIKSRPSQIVSTTRTGEVQKLVGGKSLKIKFAGDVTDDILLGVENIYKTQFGKSITTKYVKPFEYTKVPSYSKIKGFETSIKSTDIKPFEQPPISSNALQQVVKQSSQTLNIPAPELSTSIKGAAQRSVSALDIQPVVTTIPLGKIKDTEITKTLQQISPVQINAEKLKNSLKAITATRFDTAISPRTSQTTSQTIAQAVNPKLTTKQIQQLTQVQVAQLITPYAPTFTPPNIKPIVPIIPLPSYQTGFGSKQIKKLVKKRGKSEAKYAASLVSAAYQRKPIQITKEQYKKLGKRISYGQVRPVVEIVDEEEKKLKKAIQKVKF